MALQARMGPGEAWSSSWEDLEAWARAGRRLMKAEARLTCLAVSAAFNGGQAWREFMRVMRDE
jgi:hypothetical protein